MKSPSLLARGKEKFDQVDRCGYRGFTLLVIENLSITFQSCIGKFSYRNHNSRRIRSNVSDERERYLFGRRTRIAYAGIYARDYFIPANIIVWAETIFVICTVVGILYGKTTRRNTFIWEMRRFYRRNI